MEYIKTVVTNLEMSTGLEMHAFLILVCDFDGLFRQSLNGTSNGNGTGNRNGTRNGNGTGNGNFINVNGFLDIMLSFHTAMELELDRDWELREWVSNPFWNLHCDLTGEFI